ncbi:Metallo-dependent hydrolase [Pholiota conissans]|uniref:Metallo-dependent hydrolase n=1 Tax=Pholiota conissans TaxID=109636 RepID=A0A9P6CNE8_9AGAR|nr:Metallo-dependent hydrolase [Pholiota conissans]
MLVRGTFVHTPQLKTLEVLHDHLLGVNSDGCIAYLAPANLPESKRLLDRNVGPPVIEVPIGSFIMPTFCDLHLHAPQFMYQGTGLDLPLMQWLDRYALKAESRMDEDGALARRVYTRLALRLKENGTGTVLLFGTIKEETNLILAECMHAAGIRAFVGKLSMDIDITSPGSLTKTYVEPSAAASLENARSFVKHCHGIVAHLPESQRIVEPVLTPRFVPTCTDELLTGLGDLSATLGVKVQSHLAEAKDQVEWVRALRGIEDIDVFDKNNLLTPRTVQAHCTFLGAPEFDRLIAKETSIAHCPLSNAYFSAKPFPLREALDQGVKVGLGTDVAGGYSLDIMNSMRQAVSTSRIREGQRQMDPDSSTSADCSIDWKEALFIATRGGSVALGLQGIFAVGAPFDAQEIRLYDPRTGEGAGPLDYFDLESDVSGSVGDQSAPISLEYIEKWWCIGDTRNRGAVWVQGNEIRKRV